MRIEALPITAIFLERYVNTTSITCIALVLSFTAVAAFADDAYPKTSTSSNAFAPGSPLNVNNSDYFDKNGDGCLEPDEIKPDSQLAKRFATRDKNHDGKLCKDEYYFE